MIQINWNSFNPFSQGSITLGWYISSEWKSYDGYHNDNSNLM